MTPHNTAPTPERPNRKLLLRVFLPAVLTLVLLGLFLGLRGGSSRSATTPAGTPPVASSPGSGGKGGQQPAATTTTTAPEPKTLTEVVDTAVRALKMTCPNPTVDSSAREIVCATSTGPTLRVFASGDPASAALAYRNGPQDAQLDTFIIGTGWYAAVVPATQEVLRGVSATEVAHALGGSVWTTSSGGGFSTCHGWLVIASSTASISTGAAASTTRWCRTHWDTAPASS